LVTAELVCSVLNHGHVYSFNVLHKNLLRPRYTRARPVLHEAQNEVEAKTYEDEVKATEFGLGAILATRT